MKKKAPATKTVYQFLYASMPHEGVPVGIDSSEADRNDPNIRAAKSRSAWTPFGAIVLPERAPDGRMMPVPRMMWMRVLVVPEETMQVVAPTNEPAQAQSPIITVPAGTTIEDLLRNATPVRQ